MHSLYCLVTPHSGSVPTKRCVMPRAGAMRRANSSTSSLQLAARPAASSLWKYVGKVAGEST